MITQDDIVAAKLKGNANNDWVLTHGLIQQYAVNHPNISPVEYEEVKEKFESLYQGELYKSEKLIVEKEVFEILKSKGYTKTTSLSSLSFFKVHLFVIFFTEYILELLLVALERMHFGF